jgi:hypothetical protein
MPTEYSLITRKPNIYQKPGVTIYLVDGNIEASFETLSASHDSSHPFCASFMEAIGIRSGIMNNFGYYVPRQSSILNETLVAGITFVAIHEYKSRVRAKVLNNLAYGSSISCATILNKEIELLQKTCDKYICAYVQAITSSTDDMQKSKLELDRYIPILSEIFRYSRILGRKLLQHDPQLVSLWRRVSLRHQQWLNTSDEVQEFRVRSRVRQIRNREPYEPIVREINRRILTLPSCLIV